jgi:hypothetical protein
MLSQRMLKGWVMAAALVAFTAPATVWAGTLQIFEASAGSGNTRVVNGPVGGLVLNLDYDASSAETGTLFNFYVLIGTTGDLTLDAFTCQATSCLPDLTGLPNSFSASGGDDIQGETGVKNLGLLTISGTFGTIEILDGEYFDPDFGPTFVRDIDPFVLAQVVPEPGALILLGAGLAGLALLRRRAA